MNKTTIIFGTREEKYICHTQQVEKTSREVKLKLEMSHNFKRTILTRYIILFIYNFSDT